MKDCEHNRICLDDEEPLKFVANISKDNDLLQCPKCHKYYTSNQNMLKKVENDALMIKHKFMHQVLPSIAIAGLLLYYILFAGYLFHMSLKTNLYNNYKENTYPFLTMNTIHTENNFHPYNYCN